MGGLDRAHQMICSVLVQREKQPSPPGAWRLCVYREIDLHRPHPQGSGGVWGLPAPGYSFKGKVPLWFVRHVVLWLLWKLTERTVHNRFQWCGEWCWLQRIQGQHTGCAEETLWAEGEGCGVSIMIVGVSLLIMGLLV